MQMSSSGCRLSTAGSQQVGLTIETHSTSLTVPGLMNLPQSCPRPGAFVNGHEPNRILDARSNETRIKYEKAEGKLHRAMAVPNRKKTM